MSYINDPREMAIRPESGVTLEQDNRIETMYQWGAMVVDLCDLPISEYMKPITVNCNCGGSGGGGGTDTGDTGSTVVKEEVKIYLSIFRNGVLVSGDDVLFSADENDSNEVVWMAQWEWIGNFPNSIRVAATIKTDTGVYFISKDIIDNEEKKATEIIVDAQGNDLVSFQNYGVGSIQTPAEEINEPFYKENIKDGNYQYEYTYEVSTEEKIVYLTLNLVIDGVSKYSSSEMKFNDIIPFDEVNIEKEGYDFIGWYDSKGTQFTGDKMPAHNIVLNAKYEIKKCNVEFYFVINNEEELVSAYTVSYGSKASKIPSTAKVGYDFIGWEPATSTTITSDIKFYGTFEAKKYTVTWSGYTTGPIIVEYYYDQELKEPEAPSKEGYSFIGWDKTLPPTVKTNLKFTAKFKVNNYKLNYFIEIDGIKGEPVSSTTLSYSANIPTKLVPSEKGFSFTPWIMYNSATGEEYKNNKVPAFDLDIVSIKTPNTYVLTYYDNGDFIKEEEYKYQQIIKPFIYVKEGWTIISNWVLPETMPYNNLSAHCQTVINSYKVTFGDRNGNILTEVYAEYGTKISDIIPSFIGNTYIIDEEYLNGTVGAYDMFIPGDLIVNEYVVTFNIDNNETVTVKLPFGSSIDDYVLNNFKPEEGYTMSYEPTNATVPADDNLIVYIVNTINSWTLTFETFGGNENDVKGEYVLAYNTPILNVLPETNVNGYKFNGWFIEDIQVSEKTTMPNNDVYVKGYYEIETYNIIIKDGEKEVLNNTYNFGTSLNSILSEQIVIDYVNELSYNGYDAIFEIDGEEINSSMTINKDLIIDIRRVAKEYTLTFKNGNEVISSMVVPFGSVITYPKMDNFTENGVEYVFTWIDESYNGQTMPAMNLTISGFYKEKSVAPIYFGSFKVSISGYDATHTTQYFDESKIETEHYDSIAVTDCVGAGSVIYVPIIGDPEMAGMNAIQKRNYLKLWTQPLGFLLPADLADKYDIYLLNAINSNSWEKYKTDGEIVNYGGNEYKFYVMYDKDTLNPVEVSETIKYTIKLIEK